jgi:hypothetical protein
MNLFLRDLVIWDPLRESAAGYSIAIACMRELAPVAVANLRLCARQISHRVSELILVFDCLAEDIPSSVREEVREISSSLEVRLLGYNRR